MGKRIKQYKKLMRSFEHLGFRQPYQLLLTSDIILDTLKVDLIHLFEKTLSTKNLKPMITQCCIRALYEKNKGPHRDPAVVAAIERAKTFERRRCGHLMDEDPESEYDCMVSVVDPKGSSQNKFRYIVATQDESLRYKLRSVVPTPLMYVKRSVLILEPMPESSTKAIKSQEIAKFKEGIVRNTHKRKRDDDESGEDGSSDDEDGESKTGDASADQEPKKKKKKNYGKKGPNPLSVKKSAKKTDRPERPQKPKEPAAETPGDPKPKRKRRRKAGGAGGAGTETEQQPGDAAPVAAASAAEGAED